MPLLSPTNPHQLNVWCGPTLLVYYFLTYTFLKCCLPSSLSTSPPTHRDILHPCTLWHFCTYNRQPSVREFFLVFPYYCITQYWTPGCGMYPRACTTRTRKPFFPAACLDLAACCKMTPNLLSPSHLCAVVQTRHTGTISRGTNWSWICGLKFSVSS